MRRKKDRSDGATGTTGRITPKDIQEVEFRLAFRGYNERDVDAFLDRVTEDLAAYLEELERLRAGAAVPPTALDVPAASAEAERILEEARREAERILAEARARAAALGAGGGDARAAVAPFLNREREFLQSLGGLVRSHAEEIKAMVLALRAQAETPGGAEPTPAPGPAGREPEGPSATQGGSSRPTVEEAFAPISVPEAEQGRSGDERGGSEEDRPGEAEPAPAKLRRDSGERSLRELFWGED
jgi:DivIVA domain-containing protein